MARVAYPDNDDAQVEFSTVMLFQTIMAHQDLDNYEQLLDLAKPLIPNLLEARPLGEVLRAASESMADGWVAGRLLLFLIRAMTHHQELRPSVTKGIHVLLQKYRNTKNRKGADLFTGERTLWEKWRRYKPIAHFHAQIQHGILTGEYLQEPSRDTALAMANLASENFLEYLSRAESFRLLAERLRIVHPGELWSVPPDVELPSVEFEPGPLSDFELNALRTYRPPHAKGSP
jgi:hypothetical protein